MQFDSAKEWVSDGLAALLTVEDPDPVKSLESIGPKTATPGSAPGREACFRWTQLPPGSKELTKFHLLEFPDRPN